MTLMTLSQFAAVACFALLLSPAAVFAQDALETADTQKLLRDVRWKSEAEVRSILGEPISKRGPVGTHASYQIWSYANFSVAFANERAFHLFDAESLRRFELQENR